MRFLYAILFVLTLASFSALLAQPPVVLQDKTTTEPMVQQMFYFPDPEGKYTIQQVSSPAFADSFMLFKGDVPNFGFLEQPHWFLFRVQNKASPTKDFIFEVAYPPLDSLWFFYKDPQGRWVEKVAGDMLPFSSRYGAFSNYLFPIPYRPDAQSYFFKVSSQGALTMPVYIKDADYLHREVSYSFFRYGLFYGALLLMLCYNLFLYFSLRLKPYLFYCLYIFFSVLSQSLLYGHAQQFLWSQGGMIINLLTGFTLYLSNGFALLFTINFIQIKRFAPVLHRLLVFYAFLIFSLSLLVLLGPYSMLLAFIPAIYIITVVLIIVAAGQAWIKGQETARLFLLAWVLYLLGLLAYSLQSMGIFGDVETASYIVMLGSVVEALLLSLALAERIRKYRKDRQRANQQLLLSYREKQEQMEQRVSERTQKLQEKQKEVIKQNRQLFEQQQTIEQQNQQLSLLNENLERIVSTRTGELRKANLALHKRNQQLEQFAYIISHNLRGPVASIIGLIKLFDRSNVKGVENLQYLDFLDQSAVKLDAVISDLGQVLSLEQHLDKNLREINLLKVVEGVLTKLHMQVLEARPSVQLDLQAIVINSHPAYLESIIYNLISNAIKYRKEDDPLQLIISSWKQEDTVFITVSDNGMGIDLEQYGSRLFSLYQRFHIEKEGRGLGLYMVKRQVEALGGNISVESKVGEGSTFTLAMPQQNDLNA